MCGIGLRWLLTATTFVACVLGRLAGRCLHFSLPYGFGLLTMAAPPCGGWLAPPADAGRGVLVYDAFSKRIRHGLGNVFAGFVTMRALAFLSNRSLVVCDAGVLAPFLEPAGGWAYGDAAACAAPARGLPCDRGFFAASAAAAARAAGRVRCDCHRSFLHELAADPSIDVASLLGPAPCGAGAEAVFRHARSAAYRCRLRRRSSSRLISTSINQHSQSHSQSLRKKSIHSSRTLSIIRSHSNRMSINPSSSSVSRIKITRTYIMLLA